MFKVTKTHEKDPIEMKAAYAEIMMDLAAKNDKVDVYKRQVIALLKENNLECKVMVGGAVVTEQYAEQIGAAYAKDAMGAVHVARRLLQLD